MGHGDLQMKDDVSGLAGNVLCVVVFAGHHKLGAFFADFFEDSVVTALKQFVGVTAGFRMVLAEQEEVQEREMTAAKEAQEREMAAAKEAQEREIAAAKEEQEALEKAEAAAQKEREMEAKRLEKERRRIERDIVEEEMQAEKRMLDQMRLEQEQRSRNGQTKTFDAAVRFGSVAAVVRLRHRCAGCAVLT